MDPHKLAKTLGMDWPALRETVRTSVATLFSLLLARALKLPEYYWAPISTIVILLSTIDPLQGSWQRFVGTALGAALGAVFATFFGRTAVIYAAGILLCGIVASILRLWSAYRVAAITFSIVVLVSRGPVWLIAWHRFLEVSLGIAVALLAALVPPRK
ncbi:MAG: FUSC family protein [Acidobacteria bacterium]|nr:FUSC family protein [Acidobacteriota bacterium]